MSRKKSRLYCVQNVPKESAATINMNDINLKKVYHPVTFRTGRYMSEKDRPRKKNWRKEAADCRCQ